MGRIPHQGVRESITMVYLKDDSHPFIVASGRVVELLDLALDEANIDSIVATALENDISAMTIRCGVDAQLQPRLQSIIDNFETGKDAGKAFLTRHTSSNHLLLCVQYPQSLMPEIKTPASRS